MDGYLLEISHLDPFQKWALICAAALTILYTVMRPLKKKKDPLANPTNLSLAGQREVERQMTELLVELEQMARQMTAQLDTRSAKLELLIREADEKIAALRGTMPDHTPIMRIEPSAPAAQMVDARYAEIYELADSGQSPRQIAQHLNRPYGEVELILALRGRDRPQVSAS